MLYDSNDEKDLEKSFIDKTKLLEYVTEEDIFELVFEYKPVIDEYVISPFRVDNNPGCYFSYRPNGKLCFVDFANNMTINGINMSNIDCFDAVQVYFNFSNFYTTLEYIYRKLILDQKITIKPKDKIVYYKKRRTEILIKTRNYQRRDKNFWESYGISKQNLIDDKVFPVSHYLIKNSKHGDYYKELDTMCYAYTDFENDKKKLYLPYANHKFRFITNCGASDVGGINNLPQTADKLIITKSYKDYRVFKNLSLNVIWFQNEGMFPNESILRSLCNRFTNIIIFFDNDTTGIQSSHKFRNILNTWYESKANSIYLPQQLLRHKVKDVSDFYKSYGKKLLISHLQKVNVL